MALTLFLADSEVSSVTAAGPGLRVRLAAASVEREAAPPSTSATAGYCTGVVLRLDGVVVHERAEPAIGRVRAGVLRLDGRPVRSCALPAVFNAPVDLELAFANGASLRVSAQGLAVGFEGEADFHESLAC